MDLLEQYTSARIHERSTEIIKEHNLRIKYSRLKSTFPSKYASYNVCQGIFRFAYFFLSSASLKVK